MSVSPNEGASNATELRRALGSFATGVTIITTRTAEGQPLGLTVNSFNSVSLNPPLVLWSLANSSRSHEAFRNAEYWAVHVLATEQEALSGRFAKTGLDKFDGLELEDGIGGIPLLRDCTARFQCRAAFQYEGGDHLIFVGEVVEFDWTETAPLVFHGGRYARAVRPDVVQSTHDQGIDVGTGTTRPSLTELTHRIRAAIVDRISPLLQAEHLTQAEFEQLASLAHTVAAADETMTPPSIDSESPGAMRQLMARNLIRRTHDHQRIGGGHELTESGAACIVRLTSAIGQLEAQWRRQLGPGDEATLLRLFSDWLSAIETSSASASVG